MRKIKRITIVTLEGVGGYEVGEEINGLEIAEIREESIKWQGRLDRIYRAYDKEKQIVAEIINCPVDITYYEA